MTCRFCGMQTRNPQVCEWCHKQLAPAAPQPVAHGMDLTQPMPPGMEPTQAVPQHQYRTALTGEAVPIDPSQAVTQGYAPSPYSQPPPPQGYPQQGYSQQGHHPSQPQVPGRPPSVMPQHWAGLPHQAIGPDLARQHAASYQSSAGERWEKCLAIVFPILLISVWIVHQAPTSLLWVVLADFFFVALAMGSTSAIGSYDDAFMDVGAVLIVSIFFGPALGLVAYLIVGAIKQEWNGAILALLLSHILIRILVLMAFPVNAGIFSVMPGIVIMSFGGLLGICATFAGWILSSFFRPLNE